MKEWTEQFATPRLGMLALLMAVTVLVSAALIAKSATANEQVEALLNTGSAQLDAGEYDAALATFEAAIGIDPMDGRAPYMRGVTLSLMGRFDDAVNNFAALEQVGGAHPRMDLDYGTALVHAGQTDAGLARLETYAAANPEDPAAKIMISRAHIANEDYGKAANVIEGLENDPDFGAAALLQLGLAEVGRDNDEKAEAYGKLLSERYPNSAEAKALQAYMEEEEKKQ